MIRAASPAGATQNSPGFPAVMRVPTKPGFTVETVTPNGASRLRSPSRNVERAALEALYAGFPLRPRSPAMDEMPAICPRPATRNQFAARPSSLTAATALTSIVSASSAGTLVTPSPWCMTPAL